LSRALWSLAFVIISCLILAGNASSDTAGKTLTVGTMWDIPDLDPVQRGDAWTEKALITETLTVAGQDYSIGPGLASSWKQVDDKMWEFKLRDDVTFHDGSRMTADDVRSSIERAAKLDSTI
jgi:peptide/nickel transport system substrate-binding protein